MIFGINATSDISKLLHEISRAFRRLKFETILKYREWYLCEISRINQIMLLIVYTTTHKWFVIFTCRYFKLSWNTNAISQSNIRSSISGERATEDGLKFSVEVNNIAILQRQCRTLVVLFTRSTPYAICRCFVCPSRMVLYLSYIFPFTVCRVSVD